MIESKTYTFSAEKPPPATAWNMDNMLPQYRLFTKKSSSDPFKLNYYGNSSRKYYKYGPAPQDFNKTWC